MRKRVLTGGSCGWHQKRANGPLSPTPSPSAGGGAARAFSRAGFGGGTSFSAARMSKGRVAPVACSVLARRVENPAHAPPKNKEKNVCCCSVCYKQATPTGLGGGRDPFGVAGLWCGVCELPEHCF